MKRPAHLLLGIAGFAIVVGATVQVPTIAARSCHAMAYSPAAGGIIAIGGARACGVDVLLDSAVWRWDGSRWQPTGTALPSRREDVLLTYDPRRRVVVLYGGRMAGTVHSDTWELDGVQWRRRSAPTATGPGPIEHAALGFDERRGRAVLFGGGSRTGGKLDATWEWDGTAWQRANPQTSPAARVAHSMAWSAQENAVLLYGGFDDKRQFRDLWKWDGTVWTRLDSAGPAFTEGPALLPADGGTLLMGPPTDAAETLGVWRWKDASWVRIDSGRGPPVRVGQVAAYDPARKRVVLFGGSDQATSTPSADTWEFDGRRWRLVTPTTR